MDYFTINSEREENDRVLQNLKDAMKQRNLAMMRDAKKKLDARYGFYDALSDKISPWLSSRRIEYNRLTDEYNVLNARYHPLHDSLYAEERRNGRLSRLPRRPGESKWEHARRLMTPITQGGAGREKDIWTALEDIAAEEQRLKGIAPPPNPNKWKCSGCHHMNPNTDNECTMCGKPSKPTKFQMLKKSKRKSSRKRKASRKRSRKRKTSRKRRSSKRKASRKRKSSKRKASRKRSRKRRSSKRCPAGCVKKKTSKRKSRKVKKS